MKKFTALAGILLLSSSLAVGCGQTATPGHPNTNNTSRVQDIGNRAGVRNILPNANTNNLRHDRSLEARVETIPGIKNARVLVVGNTAYVAINQGTFANGQTGATSYGAPRGTTGTTGQAGTMSTNRGAVNGGSTINNNSVVGYGAGTTGTVPNNGRYGTNNVGGVLGYGSTGNGIMSGTAGGTANSLDTTRRGAANYYNAGTQTYGTAGTAGNTAGTPGVGVGPYGIGQAGTYGTGTYGTAGRGQNYSVRNPYGVTGGTAGTYGGGKAGGEIAHNGGAYGTGTGQAGTYGTAGTNGTGNNGLTGTYGTGAGTTSTGNNADVSADIKARVTAAIKQANPAIQNVFVTANPALMNRFGAFVNDIATGHPLRGGNDLLDTLRRMFPTTTQTTQTNQTNQTINRTTR